MTHIPAGGSDPDPKHALAESGDCAYIPLREVGAGECLANPVRSGRKQP